MKEKIRKELIEKRKKLTFDEVNSKSSEIKKRLFELDEFKHSQTVLFYVSYGNEVRTHEIIKECLEKKEVIVPISDKENRSLILSKLENWKNLEVGSYGILEPKKDKIKEISIENIDLIIIPGVGFDESGRRIGHGKGYYDNLLKRATKISNIGLAYEFQIVKKIPIEPHDLPVKKIVTEKRVINCKS